MRGETPAIANATNNGFVPASFIEFPRYVYNATTPTPVSSAFKTIRRLPADSVLQNTGIVNIDINRARIALEPGFNSTAIIRANGQPATTDRAIATIRNVLVQGVRLNNAAQPDPMVPGAGQNPNQRWTWRLGASVDIFVKENAIIANCRINDFDNNTNITRTLMTAADNFSQNSYAVQGNVFNNVIFDYAAQYGIMLNRLKRLVGNQTGQFLQNSEPEDEPALYALGNMVMDCWVYTTSRAKIQAAGTGLLIKNNVLRDKVGKSTRVDPTGTRERNGGTQGSFENRGIDLAGRAVLIEDNDIQVERHQFGASTLYSSDGEGVYGQGPSGTNFIDITIRNNTFTTSSNDNPGQSTDKGFNGFANTNQVQNCTVENNNWGGTPFWFNDASNEILSSNTLNSNTNLGPKNGDVVAVRMQGNGAMNYCTNNAGTGNIQRTCNVSLDNNPTVGSSTPPAGTNTGFNTVPACTAPQFPTCDGFTPTDYPELTITSPTTQDTVTIASLGAVPITISGSIVLSTGNVVCADDSVKLYVDNILVETISVTGNTYSFTYTYPASRTTPAFISLRYIKDAFVSGGAFTTLTYYSRTVIVIRDQVTGLSGSIISSRDVSLYPNPTNGQLSVEVNAPTTSQAWQIRVVDMMGRTIATKKQVAANQTATFDVSALSNGMYLLEVSNSEGRTVKKFLKQD